MEERKSGETREKVWVSDESVAAIEDLLCFFVDSFAYGEDFRIYLVLVRGARGEKSHGARGGVGDYQEVGVNNIPDLSGQVEEG